MRTVRHLLEAKSADIYSIAPSASVIDAVRLMAEHGIGALLVMEGARLVGIVSERDYARKVVLQGRASADTSVSAIMTSQLVTVRPEDTVDYCMAIVTDRRIRHLPVMRGDELVGLVSIGDLVKAVIEDQQVELDQLQRYITS
ncbi:CBS domain-containing protein [Lysobacter olei]